MRQILLPLLLSIALAGYHDSQYVTIPRNGLCVIQFASGNAWPDGRKSVSGVQGWTYSFSGLPAWLRPRESSLYGTPPAGDNGPWTITVNYNGNGVPGSTRIAIVPQGTPFPTTQTTYSSSSYTTSSPSYQYPGAGVLPANPSPAGLPSGSVILTGATTNPYTALPSTNPAYISTPTGPLPTPFPANLPTTSKTAYSVDPVTSYDLFPIGTGPSLPDYATTMVLVPVTTTYLTSGEVRHPDVYVPNPTVNCDAAQRTYNEAKDNYESLVRKADEIRPRKLAATSFDEAYALRCELALAETKASAAQVIMSEAKALVGGCKERQLVQPIPNLVQGSTVRNTEVQRTTAYAISNVGGYAPGNCDDTPLLTSGYGAVTATGDRWIEVNGNRLDFGACTSNTYNSGQSFNVGEHVNYQSYLYAGRTWARRVAFTYA